ncbi:MFS transporter, partial [Bacillaceae bacterium Marseille-Q3522]|nr:MFS transporter [Bacillaceae bacterium Marseille-Q3522]
MKNKQKLPIHIKILFLSSFCMNAGTFMVIPFLVIYLSETLNFSPAKVGTIISANVIFGRFLPILTGALGDKVSHGYTLLLGIFLRGIGFFCYALFDNFTGLIFASILVGIGGAFYDPSVMSIFSTQTDEQRKRTFTYLNQALNAGAILGPLIAAILLMIDPTTPFMLSGLLLIIINIILIYFKNDYQTIKATSRLTNNIKQIFSDKEYI